MDAPTTPRAQEAVASKWSLHFLDNIPPFFQSVLTPTKSLLQSLLDMGSTSIAQPNVKNDLHQKKLGPENYSRSTDSMRNIYFNKRPPVKRLKQAAIPKSATRIAGKRSQRDWARPAKRLDFSPKKRLSDNRGTNQDNEELFSGLRLRGASSVPTFGRDHSKRRKLNIEDDESIEISLTSEDEEEEQHTETLSIVDRFSPYRVGARPYTLSRRIFGAPSFPAPAFAPLLASPVLKSDVTALPSDLDELQLQDQEFERPVSASSKSESPSEEEESLPPFIRALSNDLQSRVPTIKEVSSEPQRLLSTIGRTKITNYVISRIIARGGMDAWLNDEAIDAFYTGLVSAANAKWSAINGTPSDELAFHAFSSAWLQNMNKSGYDGVKRWANRAKVGGSKLLQLQAVFFPLNPGNHWIIGAVFPQQKQIRVFDSMHGSPKRYLDLIRNYLIGECGESFKQSEWSLEAGKSSTQMNVYDCGVFTCFNGLGLLYSSDPSDLVPSEFRQLGRDMLAGILINGGFKDEFELDIFLPRLFTPYSA